MVARVTGWEPYDLHDSARGSFLGWTCTPFIQILDNMSLRQIQDLL